MKVKIITLSPKVSNWARKVAYRHTHVSKATSGHRHIGVSFYLTEGLDMRGANGMLYKAPPAQEGRLTLWVVLPGVFHEWVARAEKGGVVHDLTPLHAPHVLAA